MRYIVVLAVIILLVRIDFFLGLFDKLGSIQSESAEIKSSDILDQKVTIPLTKDQNIQLSAKEKFLGLLEVFRISPEKAIREKALALLQENPRIFGEKLDSPLESSVFRWRDLLINKEPEVVTFLLALLQALKGENKDMVKRFLSLWMDIEMESFLQAYARINDADCSLATLFGDPISNEAKLNLLLKRRDNLKKILQRDSLDPLLKNLASNCLMATGLTIERLSSKKL